MNPARRRAIFQRLQAANPSPTTELLHATPFELLAAVMLSAHTTDKSVNGATRNLYPVANTPEAIVKLGVEGVKSYIKTVGLYNTKAKNLVALAQQIVDKHRGEVPGTREDLEALPGVGRKTASIILNMVFGQNEIAVDTHIFRVANRTGLAPGKNPRQVEDELVATTPKEYLKDAHHWLLLHGRYVCVARVPACPKCIIADLCEYPNKTPAKNLDQSDAPVARRIGPRPEGANTAATKRTMAKAGKAAKGAKGSGNAGRAVTAANAAASAGRAVTPANAAASAGRAVTPANAAASAGRTARTSNVGGRAWKRATASGASGRAAPAKRKRRAVGKLI
jgi:endonuclease-3